MRPGSPSIDVLLVVRALSFAAQKHVDQRRKGKQAEPYINHLAEVAELLAVATNGADAALVAAGLLHDSIEDVGVTSAELTEQFGAEIANLVDEVTDDKSLPKAERKRLQVATVTKKSARARLLKIADKTSNLRALVRSPPEGWDRQRLSEYVDWAEAVVSQSRGANAYLDHAFIAARDAARADIQSQS